MLIGQVIGNVVSTVKDQTLVGFKLLLVQKINLRTGSQGKILVAVDTVGVGENELVLVTEGTPAASVNEMERCPIDASIIGVIDELKVGDETRTGTKWLCQGRHNKITRGVNQWKEKRSQLQRSNEEKISKKKLPS